MTTQPIESKPFDEAIAGMNDAAKNLDEVLFNYLESLNPGQDETQKALFEITRIRVLLDAVEKLIIACVKNSNDNAPMTLKAQIVWLVNRLDDNDEKLLEQLLRIANRAYNEGRVQ